MRIIGGIHKGRRLNPPKSLPVRPTTDLAKESLFNILNNRVDFEGIQVLDLFAGTGNITFEFASRGAEKVIAVDISFRNLKYIKEVSVSLDMPAIKTVKGNVLRLLPGFYENFDIIFADPPYDLKELGSLPDLVLGLNLLKKDGIFILEHDDRFDFSGLAFFQENRHYGKVNFSFFKK